MKAISPVIATVIIVAVTIAVAIAVALWIAGLTGAFTGTENLQIITAYAESKQNATNITVKLSEGETPTTSVCNVTYTWRITLEVKNVGTADATIDRIFINGKPHDSYGNSSTTYTASCFTNGGETGDKPVNVSIVYVNISNSNLTLPLPLKAGSSTTIYIYIMADKTFAPGQMVEVKLHTASGKEYPKMVTLP